MHNKIFIIITILLLGFLPVQTGHCENVELLDKAVVEENVIDDNSDINQDVIKTTPKTANIIEQSASWPYQNDLGESLSPQPKQELFRVLKSFLKVMIGVLISSIIISLILLFVRKFYGIPENNPVNKKREEENLKSSDSQEDALKNFLNKTR